LRKHRKSNQIRKPKISVDFCPNARGSVLFEMEHTRVICAASVSDDVPDHAAAKGTGWISAEYSLLPYSTNTRTNRPLLTRDGRAVEIQRVISRSLRGVIDLSLMPGVAIHVDCDVLEADGGTRTASITGSYIALKCALTRLVTDGTLSKNPLVSNVAAVSTGYVGGELLLDLDYAEDSRAEVDLNVIMDGKGNLIEVQGTGERAPFTVQQLIEMISLSRIGISELVEIQDSVKF